MSRPFFQFLEKFYLAFEVASPSLVLWYLNCTTFRGVCQEVFQKFFEIFLDHQAWGSLTLHTNYSTFGKPCQYFFKKFWKIFWNNLPPSACPFTILQLVSVGFVWGVSPPDMIIIPHPPAEVKHFGKNKKINIFVKTLDKFCEPWYNSEFGPRRMCADRHFITFPQICQ